MKTVIFMRHGEAVSAGTHRQDHARVLTKAGIIAAQMIGEKLRINNLGPELIISSDAKRTVQTEQQLQLDCERSFSPELYLADPGTYLEQLRRVSDATTSVMLIGHNPGIAALVRKLSGKQQAVHAFPPASTAVFELDAPSWAESDETSDRWRRIHLWSL